MYVYVCNYTICIYAGGGLDTGDWTLYETALLPNFVWHWIFILQCTTNYNLANVQASHHNIANAIIITRLLFLQTHLISPCVIIIPVFILIVKIMFGSMRVSLNWWNIIVLAYVMTSRQEPIILVILLGIKGFNRSQIRIFIILKECPTIEP